MKTSEIISAWSMILRGEQPSLSIEITRECPRRCPGCYAYDGAHLSGGMTLRGLPDRKGQELIDSVLEVVDRLKPLKEFLEYWTPRAEICKVWFSLFTPQVGDQLPEMLQAHECRQAIADMLALRKEFPKLDMPEGMIRQFLTPPRSPEECVCALTTQTLSADLKTKIVPCQFGGNLDCGSCGCVASMGLAAVAAHKLGGIIPVGAIFKTSTRIGQARSERTAHTPIAVERLRVPPLGIRVKSVRARIYCRQTG